MPTPMFLGDNYLPPEDRMIDPASGEVWRIDDRLLLKKTWVESPILVRRLLTDLSNQIPSTPLAVLAGKFLDLTSRTFPGPGHSENDDFLLVLGHALDMMGQPSTELIGRLDLALEWYRANPLLRIIASGKGEKRGLTESAVMANWLIARGVPQEAIFLES